MTGAGGLLADEAKELLLLPPSEEEEEVKERTRFWPFFEITALGLTIDLSNPPP